MKKAAVMPRPKREEALQLFGYHFAKQSIEVPYFPPIIWIEPTSVCNLRCPMCITGSGKLAGAPSGMMTMGLFRRILGQLKDRTVLRTALFFRGEPLLHPDIVEMVRLASEAGVSPYFHSNGTLMTAAMARMLIEAGLTYISFSFDGENAQEYERCRVGGTFRTTLDNIRTFLKTKKSLGAVLPRVVVQKIDFDGKGMTESYKSLFCGLPVDDFTCVPLHNWSGEIGEVPVRKKGDIYPCPDPWQRLTICFDGSVVACCNDMMQKYLLGDASKDDLHTIWNDRPIQELRRMMKGGTHKDAALCKECALLYVDKWLI